MANDKPKRQNAIAHGALDAEVLINTVPGLMRLLSANQVYQIQSLLDAAVVNPILQQEADDIYRKSITLQIGQQVNRDPAMVERAQKIYDKMIPISEKNHHIRLNYKLMMALDAFIPRTDNPDEADYLSKVKHTLDSRGVWLRITQPFVRSSEDRSVHHLDPRQWQLWFSLGYDGGAIKTADATIDRDELLSNAMLGAGYYTSVHTGIIQTKLEQKFGQLGIEIEDGLAEHDRLITRYRHAAIGVAEISDFIGGAELPHRGIWVRPQDLITKARYATVGGNVVAAQVYVIVAAKAVQYNAELLADYAERSSSGAASAVGILRVAKTACEIAGTVLLLTGVGVGIARLGSRAAQEVITGEVVEKFIYDYAKKNGIAEAELSVPRYIKMPKGTTLGNMKGAHSSGIGTTSYGEFF